MDVFEPLFITMVSYIVVWLREGTKSYHSQFQQDFPDAEIIQAGLEPNFSEKGIQTSFLTELSLDVQMTAIFPTVHKRYDVI